MGGNNGSGAVDLWIFPIGTPRDELTNKEIGEKFATVSRREELGKYDKEPEGVIGYFDPCTGRPMTWREASTVLDQQ